VPPTGQYPEYYHKPMEDWLKSFEIDTGKQKIKPNDHPTDRRHAATHGR
jgi:peptide/nickel transport system substrate-binding protein